MNDLALEDMNLLLAHFKGSAWSRFRDEVWRIPHAKCLWCQYLLAAPRADGDKEAEGKIQEQSHRDVSECIWKMKKRAIIMPTIAPCEVDDCRTKATEADVVGLTDVGGHEGRTAFLVSLASV